MAIKEAVESLTVKLKGEPSKVPVPSTADDRIRRGRERMRRDASRRNECLRMWRGDQYVWVDEKGLLQIQPTVTHVTGGGKAPHRVRTTRNLLQPIVRQEVAYATQRVPSYQVSPSTNDPQDIDAARLAQQVALWGFDAWHVRDVTVKAVTYALVADEAFAWPFFDNTKGERIEGDLHTGDVNIRVFGPNEVYWEPGVRFEDSSWHCVEHAMPLDEVPEIDGFLGGKLAPDAHTSDVAKAEKLRDQDKMVLVTEYLERPCRKYPEGRWLTVANERVISGVHMDMEEGVTIRPYPVQDGYDEPCLHRLAYITDPDNDRDMGLVRHLLDAQRTYNDCVNKLLEAKNLGLNPQVLAKIGSLKNRLTDMPGDVIYYRGSDKPEFRDPPPAQLFNTLFDVMRQAKEDIAMIAAQNDIPSQVEAARAIEVLIERDQNSRQEFVANLAQWHSRLMRHCLHLTAKHFTEGRLLQIRGDYGTEHIENFRGSQLRGQVDVRVMADSIEPRTRQAIEQKVTTLFQLGLISPEQALAGLNGGAGERIVTSYERDVARANRIIQRLKQGPEAILSMPPRFDARFVGPDNPGGYVPGWMPREFDNARVSKAVLEDWMKTEDHERQPPEVQEIANLIYEGVKFLIAKEEAEAAMAQSAMAAELGEQNAAAPQAKPLPSLPKPQG